MSFARNNPLGARLALFVSNEMLRRHKLLRPPELFLEGQKMEKGKLSDSSYVVRTTYSSFQKRERIEVYTWISRHTPDRGSPEHWGVFEAGVGTVKVDIHQGKSVRMSIERGFRITWDYMPGLFGDGRIISPFVEFFE